MKKTIRSFVTVLFIMLLALPVTVMAKQNCSTTFKFKVSLEGKTRSFDDGKIQIKVDSKATPDPSMVPASKKFKVDLYKKGAIFYTYVGTCSVKRNGVTTKKWTNMVGGKYRFDFSKANDGEVCKGDMEITQ